MISCVTTVMNREEHLEKMLPSWTHIDKIKDFVIVDWSSTKPIIDNEVVKNEMRKFNKLKIIRVENQKYFNRCLAWNLGNQYTNPYFKILLKLDIDYVNIDEKWMNCLCLQEDKSLDNYFITGSYKFYENSLGFLVVNKRDFGNGYNENLLPIWGYEDQDLIKRLEKSEPKYTKLSQNEWPGVKHILFFNIKDYVYHINHVDESRAINEENYKKLFNSANNFSREKLYASSRENAKIAIEKKTWQPRKFNVIEDCGNYIRVELI
jgi:hypothetical protein